MAMLGKAKSCGYPLPQGFFIVGMPRSGTTLLSMLLNAHSQVRVSFETHYFGRFYRPCQRRKALSNPATAHQFVCSFLDSPEVNQFGLSLDEKRYIYQQATCKSQISHSDILSALLQLYAQKQNKAIWGEKTPEHFFYIPQIMQLFPQTKIVGLVRDPRDVHLSLQSVPWAPGNIVTHARLWRKSIALMEQSQRQYPQQVRIVRYEDVLRQPEQELANLCRFLGIVFEEQMLARPQASGAPFDPDQEPWKQKNLQPLDPANSYKWRQRMPARDTRLMQAYLSESLQHLNYSAAPQPWQWHDSVYHLLKELQSMALFLNLCSKRLRQRLKKPFTIGCNSKPE